MDKSRIIIFSIVGAVILAAVLIGYGFLFGGDETPEQQASGELDVWVLDDDRFVFQSIIQNFNTIYPNVDINFRSFSYADSYERSLINALAAGTGPDVFMIRNNDIFRKDDKISPLPSEKYSLLNLQNQFPDVVEENFVFNNSIFALPLSVDTLSMIYNSSIFEEEGVVFPPETWTEFRDIVPQLTEMDSAGIERAGAAIGGAENVRRSKDIVSSMLMQAGVNMVNDSYSSARFNTGNAVDVLEFYTQFASPTSQYYTWNENMPESREAFNQERAAIIFDYSSALVEIESQSPFMEVETASMPQFEGTDRKISYAHYWGYTVSSQSEMPGVAWDFILSFTTNPRIAEQYLTSTNKPPALLTLINGYLENPRLSTYTNQALTATSWHEPDPERVTDVFHNMIEDVVEGNLNAGSALTRAVNQVSDMIRGN